MIVEELVAMLGFDLEGEANLQRFNQGIARAGRGLSTFARQASMVAATAGAAVGAGFGLLSRSIVDAGADFQDLAVTLETIEGSSAKAKESLDWISDFATRTPYDINQVAKSFTKLRAYGLEPQSGLLRSIGDAASAMGKSMRDGVEAVADAVTGENERLKEFGIRASVAGDQITYSWSQNGQEMQRTVSKNADEIQAALVDIFDARFMGQMERRSKTFRGIMANIGDIWINFQRKIADAGFFPWVQEQFKGVLDTLDRFRKDGTLDRVAQTISDTLIATGEELKSLFSGVSIETIRDGIVGLINAFRNFMSMGVAVKDAFSFVANGINELVGAKDSMLGFAAVIGAIGLAFAPWTTALVAFFVLLEDLVGFLQGKDSAIGFVLQNLQDKLNEFGFDVDFSPEAIKKAFADLGGALSEFQDVLKAMLAGGAAAVLVKLAQGIAALTMALIKSPIVRIFLMATALWTLGNALKGVDSFDGLVDALGQLSAFDWAAIAFGAFTVAGAIRKLVGAMKGLCGVRGGLPTTGTGRATPPAQGGSAQAGGGGGGPLAWLAGAGSKAVRFGGPLAAFFAGMAPGEANAGEDAWVRDNLFGPDGAMRNMVKGAHDAVGGAVENSLTGPLNEFVRNQQLQPAPAGGPQSQAPRPLDDLARELGIISQGAQSVAPERSLDAMQESIANDNRSYSTSIEMTNQTTINATSSQSAQQIGNSVERGVSRAGNRIARDLAVTGNSGGAQP